MMGSLLFAFAIVSLMLPTTGAAAQTRPRAGSTSAELSSALEATTALAAAAVVQIFTTSSTPANGLVPRTTDLVTTERASGSGVIVDPDGFLVTNAHVVRGAQRLRVEIPAPITGQSILAQQSRTVTGQVVGIDRTWDSSGVHAASRMSQLRKSSSAAISGLQSLVARPRVTPDPVNAAVPSLV